MATPKKASAANSAKATAKQATFVGGKQFTYAALWAWVNTNAAGNLHNVQVVPLSNVQAGTAQPVPFGYNGKAGGVRATIQNWLLQGVNGNTSLHAILAAAKPLGHSSKKPVCLAALLQGGYSSSSATWGTPYVKLVVQPQAK
ncbi:MAG: hypothetical protein Unbinned4834contig1000_51 [Prokaryotic dsDNA virus sp.]|nr:MAG: hypothetical protein Unbinned4834contig1000_51 [Prokaryotic dsDNA virus sp.]|tara:strand:- start:21813 stop:22241 length:429 start_codon:yes stop_codon:yes gene_type:complete